MKKSVLLLALVFATFLSAQAQVGLGIRAGANYSGFSGEGAKDLDMIWGFHGGLTFNLPVVEDFFSIQPEILYSMKGAENKNDTEKWRSNYIDVPVLGRVNAGPLYFEAGPQFSLRAGGETPGPAYSKENFKRGAFGYAAGLGLQATAIGASIGIRYAGDATKFLQNTNTSADNHRNSVFMLTLGFGFPGRR